MSDQPSPGEDRPGRPTPAHQRDLPGLDGLRAVAVLMVVLCHSADDLGPGNFLRPIADIGTFGVVIFFVLSGFLITHLLLREEERSGRVDLGAFYLRRAIRILPPVYFLVTVFAVLTGLGWLNASSMEFTSCLLFFRNYAVGTPVTLHLWSLAVEEHFYLAWPAVFVICRTPSSRLWVVGIVVAWAPIWRRITIWLAGSADVVNWFRTDLKYDGILVGCLLALLTRVDAAERWLGSRPMKHGVASCLAIAALAGTFSRGFSTLPLNGFAGPTIQYLCVAVVLNQVVRRPEGPLTRFLDLAAIAWVGRLSYSIYLWQQPFSPVSWPGLGWRAVHLPWNLVPIAATSMLSYYLVERPFFALRARFRQGADPGKCLGTAGGGGPNPPPRDAAPRISTAPALSRGTRDAEAG